MAQVQRFQDCSGKSTHYRYDERHHLVAVTDALNNTLEGKFIVVEEVKYKYLIMQTEQK
nr:RHS repeat domain-containing protein [Pseudomonas savastanoi]